MIRYIDDCTCASRTCAGSVMLRSLPFSTSQRAVAQDIVTRSRCKKSCREVIVSVYPWTAMREVAAPCKKIRYKTAGSRLRSPCRVAINADRLRARPRPFASLSSARTAKTNSNDEENRAYFDHNHSSSSRTAPNRYHGDLG